jgi:MFS family permease
MMESTPLLPQHSPSRPNGSVFLLVALIIFTFIETGTYMLLIPQTWIYESILCKQYYNDGCIQTPEHECKIAPIQGEVAKIRAVSSSIVAIPGILFSVPYGQLADNPKIGRKIVLAISYVGVLFQVYTELLVCWLSPNYSGISLRLEWLAPLWTVLGGGSGVLGAVIFTMITDAVDISQRCVFTFPSNMLAGTNAMYSSTAFVYVSLSLQISQLVAPVVTS